ncbi:transglycosylase SLT domain-containing protein [Sporocytophaga myxococcoides]|uniref:transglycosylase SLT domain-containing protein n=1 Tax=Sporocytophaga myxococcoides TaxID=153721 RepID=UPI00040EB384|nr:transporter substrate-binding domain-containing protein [Sporocytophaga myxococcoides]
MRRILQQQKDFVFLYFIISVMCLSCSFAVRESEETCEGNIGVVKEDRSEKQFQHLIKFVNNNTSHSSTDLHKIRQRGVLKAITGLGRTSYHINKNGTPGGFEYEMLHALAKHLNIKLEIVVAESVESMYDMLKRGEADLIAYHLVPSREREDDVSYTIPYNHMRQVIVQRSSSSILKAPSDLAGKTIHVPKGSPFRTRLEHLEEEIGEDIHIQERTKLVEEEDLLLQVAMGKIDYTVAEENIALLARAYYPNLDIQLAISYPQKISWAVGENAPDLLMEINGWMTKYVEGKTFTKTYNKYFRSGQYGHVQCGRSKGKNLSQYDCLIKKSAKEIGWDWRLLAALVYHESKFNPLAKSWAGACGLMQLMPSTAALFGLENPEDPYENMKAGIKYLKWLDKYWKEKVPDKDERLKFVLASYNAGQAHVADAQRLAIKYEKDPLVWDDNVAYFLLQKAQVEYYSDPVVKFGYCRGSETFNYVSNIISKFQYYKQLIPDEII